MILTFTIIDSKKLKISVPKEIEIIGSYLSSYFIWINEYETLKEGLLFFLKNPVDERSKHITRGTYDDLFLEYIEKGGIRKVRIYAGHGIDYPYDGWEVIISTDNFQKILSVYLEELDKFKKDPGIYIEELKKLGGEKEIELSI